MAFVLLNWLCIFWVYCHLLYYRLSYLAVIPIWLELAHATQWCCKVRPVDAAASTEMGLGLLNLLASFLYSTSVTVWYHMYLASTCCLFSPSGCNVYSRGSPGHLVLRPAIVQQKSCLPCPTFNHAIVCTLPSQSDAMECILDPIWPGWNWWVTALKCCMCHGAASKWWW